MVTKTTILANYKQSIKIIVKIILSNYINNGVFFQLSDNRLLHLIAFFSKNFNPAKYNYKIHNKDLLAIIKYFK